MGAGAEAHVISPAGDQVCAWNHTEWGGHYPVDLPLDAVDVVDLSSLHAAIASKATTPTASRLRTDRFTRYSLS